MVFRDPNYTHSRNHSCSHKQTHSHKHTHAHTRMLTRTNTRMLAHAPTGTDHVDDTAGMQTVIDAAGKVDRGAMTHVPAADYQINASLDMTGREFGVESSGLHTSITLACTINVGKWNVTATEWHHPDPEFHYLVMCFFWHQPHRFF